MVSKKRIFKVFPIISLRELYMGMAAISRRHMKFEEIWSTGFRVPRCERMDRQTDDRWGVITIAHP